MVRIDERDVNAGSAALRAQVAVMTYFFQSGYKKAETSS